MDILTEEISNLFQILNKNNFKSLSEKEVGEALKKDKAQQQKVQREIEDLQAVKVDALRMKVLKKITNEEYQLLVEDHKGT
jgi:arginine repressor